MNKFLKELMTLATELNKAEGFNALTVINDMELCYENHIAELKTLAIPDVTQQRELLKAYTTVLYNAGDITANKDTIKDIEDFIRAFNGG